MADKAGQDEATSPPGRATASGWYAVESDHTVRGWCRVKGRLRERLTVAVAIDGAVVGTMIADRFSQTLVDSGEGDGWSAFACAIPAAARDGGTHDVTVEIVTPEFAGKPLKSKQASFALPATAAGPAVTLHRLGPDAIEGVVTGAGLREELDVWLDGRRLGEDEYAVVWGWGDRQRMPFSLRVKDRPPIGLAGADVAIAYPGMREAGGGAPVSTLVAVAVTPHGRGDYVVEFGPTMMLPHAEQLTARIFAEDGDDAPLAERRLTLDANRAGFTLSEEESRPRMRMRLTTGAGAPLGSDIPFARGDMPPRLIANGAFARWSDTGPDGFAPGEGIEPERGFYAFPPALKRELGLSGTLLALPIAPGGEQSLLRQALARFGEPGRASDIGLGLFARASAPVVLTLRIVAEDGAPRASASFMAGQRWRRDQHVVRVDPGAGEPLWLELAARIAGEATEPASVEVAGLHCGQPQLPDFTDARAAQAAATRAPGANLVVNADLVRWPEGLAPEVRGGRFELADGWTLAGAAPGARVAALPAPGDAPGRYALALTLPEVPEACRLDVALDVDELTGTGEVCFSARLGAMAPPPGAGQVPPAWTFIDRIAILRRQTYLGEDEATATVQRIALVARRVAITRAGDSYVFPFTITPAAEERIDPARIGDGPADHFLSFEFQQPTALVLHGADVRLTTEPTPPPPLPLPLTFEDRTIRAQIDTLRGLEAWRAREVLRPAAGLTAPAAAAPEPLRWSWTHAALGAVEVAVCVHDAADETLACLASLVGASAVPHTVRIVDDGSGEDTRQRLAAFVADKPWMTLVSNDENRGYTASANRAVAESGADWVILLNSDTIVAPGWIEGLLAVAGSDARVALVGPVSNAATYQSIPELYDGTGKWAVNPLPPGLAPADMAALVAETSEQAFPEVPLLNGFCTLIRRAAFMEVGGFDEQAFPAGYGEENDLCLRIAKAGWRLRVADQVYVHHVKSASFGAARRAELSKAGDRALRALHPDVDIGALGRRFLATPALAELRARIAAAYPLPGAAAARGDG